MLPLYCSLLINVALFMLLYIVGIFSPHVTVFALKSHGIPGAVMTR